MSNDWLTFALVVVAAAGLIFLPGILLGASFRLKGVGLLAFAPAVTTALVGILAIVYEKVHLPWSWMTFLGGVVILAVAVRSLRTWLGLPRVEEPRVSRRWLVIGIVAGGMLIGTRFLIYLGAPDAISQTNDAVFHLNALRYVLETQSASSLTVSGVLGATSVYPAAWHGLVALVVGVTGSAVPVAVNAVSLVIAGVVWPLGIAWFTLVVTRSAPTAAVAAALSGSMIHFPMLMLQWGVLYPNELAIALVPAALAIVLHRPLRSASGSVVWLPRVFLAFVALAALGLAQPVAALTWVILLACWTVVHGALRGAATVRRRVLMCSVVLLLLVVIWLAVSRVSGGSHWGPYGDWRQALGELALTAQVELPAMPLLTVLLLFGLVVVIRRREVLWLALAWAGLVLLMVIATSVANPLVRDILLGPWYADQYRIAATLPLIQVPLMAIGVLWAVRWVASRVRPRSDERGIERVAVVSAAVVVGGALVIHPIVQMPLITEGITDTSSRYVINDHTYLSIDERALIQRLPEVLPADATIIGNPSTGMGFAFALSGVNAIPKTWSPPGGKDWDILAYNLRDLTQDPQVCPALRAMGDPEYVLDFGIGETTAGRFKLPGLTDFDGQAGFEIVARDGEASLWRITGCG